ncbi:MAG: hypothetical protein AAF530_06440 [Pseudomonadota bacterium]
MKRGLAIILGILVVLVVVVVVGGFVLFSQLDGIAKAAIEKIGSDATKTQVTLNEVKLSPFDGKGSLIGFRMTNPEGFQSDDAFKFNEISVAVDVASLMGDPIVIKRVLIANPEITYEIGPDGSNLSEIEKNVGQYVPAGSESGGSSSSGGGDGLSPDVIIKKFSLEGAKVTVVASQLLENGLSGELPAIELKNIGTKENGIPPEEAAKEVLNTVLPEIIAFVGKMDLGEISKQLEGKAKEAVDKAAKKAIDKVGDNLGDEAGGALEGTLEGAGEKAGDAINNLLNNSDN